MDPQTPRPTGPVFVGRRRELDDGLSTLDEALAGHGRLLLVAGEPGIGKSRLADELAARATERGARVVWGRCWEAGGAPAFWPWVQLLRSLMHGRSTEQLRVYAGSGAADLGQLVPDLRLTLGDFAAAATPDPDAARFRLFDSVATFLRSLSVDEPLMVVLDDLQVADTPSLLLLRFVASSLGGAHVMVLGTYRDTEVTATNALAKTLAELAREQSVRRVSLLGLTEDDVDRFITETTGRPSSIALARAVHVETEGNPLFVGEVVRLLAEEGGLTSDAIEPGLRVRMARGVREVVSQRLRHLPDASLEMLELASVLGREFSLVALAHLADRSFEAVVSSLDAPLAAHVISDVPGTRSWSRFSHVVIRESLYDDIPRGRRMQLHHQAVSVLEALYADEVHRHLAELAYHSLEAAHSGDAGRTIRYARQAGDNAMSVLAYEEAVRLYLMALQALEVTSGADLTVRCDVLLALGDAQGRGGDEAGSKETFFKAAVLARSHGFQRQLIEAALGYGGRYVWARAGGDAHVIPLLEDALAAVGTEDSMLGVRVRARITGALRDRASREPGESLSRQAVEMARRIKDPATLAYALGGMDAAMWRPDATHARFEVVNEMIMMGERAGDREQTLQGHQNRILIFFELGDMVSVRRELDTVERIAQEIHQPAQSWLAAGARALLAMFEGRFDEAETLTADAIRVGGRSNSSDARSHHAFHLFQLRKEQGRLPDMEQLISRCAQEYTWYPMFRCALAALRCEIGHDSQGRAEFDELATNDFAAIPFDNEWLISISLLAEVAHHLADELRARTLYDMLLPYEDRNAFGSVEGCMGSVARYLGLLSATMSRSAQAVAHLEVAVLRNASMGARPWVAHSEFDLAATLLLARGADTNEDARNLLLRTRRTCEQLGMAALDEKAGQLLERLGEGTGLARGTRSAPAEEVEAAPAEGTWRLEGEYWTIAYAGRVLRLRNSKGLVVIARLLSTPGRPHPSVDLERLTAPGPEPVATALIDSDAGVLLDAEARKAYRARIVQLRQTIEEADAAGRGHQADRLRDESEFLAKELSRAFGFGGRSRVAGSTTERSRLNVTRAVKSAIRRIADGDAALAAHLDATVRTGTVCVYAPDPRSTLAWDVTAAVVH